jgi:dTDP-4-dehydrorhamnose reductase
MTMKKVAILGGCGMLGSDLVTRCRQSGMDVGVYDLPAFDVTNPEHVSQAIRGATAVVNCAAYTNVDGAESNERTAFAVNAEAVGRLGELARAAGLWVLHISTDFVFDGRLDRPYHEQDAPNPISTYGRSKLEGERLLQRSGCAACVVRIEWTYGRHGKNFVTKLLERARSGGELKVVDDQIGAPTATTEVAAALCSLLAGRPEGLYHFASSGCVSRFGVAEFIVKRLSLANKLVPCKTTDFPSLAARPLNSRFDCHKIRPHLDGAIAPWQVSLGEFLEHL